MQDVEVLVTGTFNLVHAQHVQLLEFASRWGRVTVGINADPYVQRKYQDLAIPLVNRSYVLRSNRFVDDVVVFPEDEPSRLIRRLRPKYYVRGPDYRDVDLPEQPALDEVGCKLIIRPGKHEFSSTELAASLPSGSFAEIDVLDF